ncbi:MAG: hypothetical protein ACK5KL_13245 [Dysgonomonas sp.]
MKSPCSVPGTITATGGNSYSSVAGGFNIKLVGVINNARIVNYGSSSIMWNSSSASRTNGWVRVINTQNTGVARSYGAKIALYSVRCKQN